MSHLWFPKFENFWSTNNLWQNLNDTVEFNNLWWYSSIAFHCTAPTWWVVTFEATFDWTNREAVSMRSVNNDIFTSNTDDDSDFLWSISSARAFRWRTSTWWSASWTVMWRAQRDAATLEWIEFWNPPHRFWFTPVHKDASYTTAQTWSSLWTPASWKRYVVTDMTLAFTWATDATVKIFDETDSSGNYLYKSVVDVSLIWWWAIYHLNYHTPFVAATVDNILKITTSADIDIDTVLHWYEI